MLKILVVFGSKSDSKVYEGAAKELKQKGIEYDLRICSAHRTPEFLDKIMKRDYKVIIAGAGLAAHLPGVIASKTLSPVIGVPVEANFEGIDSLLSIIQMPPGIPVLGVGINNAKEAAIAAERIIEEGPKEVNIIGDSKSSAVKKCTDVLGKFEIKYTFSKKPSAGKININFFGLRKESPKDALTAGLTINVPVLENSEAEDVFDLAEKTKRGVFVGLNRGDNAAIAAVEIMDVNSRFKKKLIQLRKEMRESVLADNNLER